MDRRMSSRFVCREIFQRRDDRRAHNICSAWAFEYCSQAQCSVDASEQGSSQGLVLGVIFVWRFG